MFRGFMLNLGKRSVVSIFGSLLKQTVFFESPGEAVKVCPVIKIKSPNQIKLILILDIHVTTDLIFTGQTYFIILHYF